MMKAAEMANLTKMKAEGRARLKMLRVMDDVLKHYD